MRKKFSPPIENRETEELISIAHNTTDYWQQEAINQAKIELENRRVSKEYQLELITKWTTESKEFQRLREKELKENESKEYSIFQRVIIFFISPLILFGKVSYDMSITELKNENFKIKVRQRKITLISGLLFYLLIFYFLSQL